MKFDDYEQTYASTYTEFAELVRFLLEDAIKKTEGVPRPQSTQARGKDVTSLKRKLKELRMRDYEVESEWVWGQGRIFPESCASSQSALLVGKLGTILTLMHIVYVFKEKRLLNLWTPRDFSAGFWASRSRRS